MASTSGGTTHRIAHGRSRASRPCRRWTVALAATDALLISLLAVTTHRSTAPLTWAAMTVLAGATVMLIGWRLLVSVNRRRLFRTRLTTTASALVGLGAAALWVEVMLARPIDTLVNRGDIEAASGAFATFITAAACTTFAVAAAFDAADAARRERNWGDFIRR